MFRIVSITMECLFHLLRTLHYLFNYCHKHHGFSFEKKYFCQFFSKFLNFLHNIKKIILRKERNKKKIPTWKILPIGGRFQHGGLHVRTFVRHPEGRTIFPTRAGCRKVSEEKIWDSLGKVRFRMNHRDEDENGRKDVTQDETVRHVETVKRTRRAEDADVALVGREVDVAFDEFFSSGPFYIDNLKFSE